MNVDSIFWLNLAASLGVVLLIGEESERGTGLDELQLDPRPLDWLATKPPLA